ncbi:MAG: TIGR03084 family protein [Deltaproteobacteria bacterium]|nr:TIGR03084 family protein [Deltaproteobacteria bacterium]
MLQQAYDFRDECEDLFALLDTVEDHDWGKTTQFKEWTVNDVVAHLHFGNYLADLSLRDSAAFLDFIRNFTAASKHATGRLAATHAWLAGTKNHALLQRWREFSLEMTERFAVADPSKRVKWVGPDMSVRSSITARLMETWAHGQAVYDVLGQVRHHADRIKNVAVLGINTFGWTFTNRRLPVPTDSPYVRLTAPSGAIWEWNSPTLENCIEGSAVEFCQVVAQTRNLGDTALRVVGETATTWMAMAQCFAGPPETPPAAGRRFRQT